MPQLAVTLLPTPRLLEGRPDTVLLQWVEGSESSRRLRILPSLGRLLGSSGVVGDGVVSLFQNPKSHLL